VVDVARKPLVMTNSFIFGHSSPLGGKPLSANHFWLKRRMSPF
jgi:hypothetical protein